MYYFQSIEKRRKQFFGREYSWEKRSEIGEIRVSRLGTRFLGILIDAIEADRENGDGNERGN
jgi:hypothetical protein